MRRAGALLLLALAAPVLGAERPTQRDVREAERLAAERREAAETAAARARAAAEEEGRLTERRVAAAASAQAAEAEVLAARARLADLQAQRREAADAAEARSAALAPMVPAMLRLSLWPAETVLAAPVPPEEALRGALLLRTFSRRLAEEAAALREAEADVARLAAAAEREARALSGAERAARQAAEAVEAELAAARTRRAGAEAAEERADARAQEAASRAGDLAEMLERLERDRAREEAEARAARAAVAARRAAEARAARRPPPEPEREEAALPAPLPAPSGRGTPPVAGRVVTGWGEQTAAGPHRGLTYAAAAGARVVSPCGGRVVFSAPFRSLGLLLIVDCGGGYHFVLAGLERLDASAGQRVAAGEPVGVLGGSGTPGGGSLYVELRRASRPVDPRSWFAARG